MAIVDRQASQEERGSRIHCFMERFHAAAISIELEMERRPWVAPVIVLTLMATFGWWFAGKRMLWLDEWATYRSSTMPRSISTMEMLRKGIDLVPPLFIETERMAVAIFGPTEQGIRVPAIRVWIGT